MLQEARALLDQNVPFLAPIHGKESMIYHPMISGEKRRANEIEIRYIPEIHESYKGIKLCEKYIKLTIGESQEEKDNESVDHHFGSNRFVCESLAFLNELLKRCTEEFRDRLYRMHRSEWQLALISVQQWLYGAAIH